MKEELFPSDTTIDDELSPLLLELLLDLPSEQGHADRETDAAVLAHASKALKAIRRRKMHMRLWPSLAAAACLIIALVLHFKPNTEAISGNEKLNKDKYALILREVSAVFPEQIQSIITDGGELRITLADQPIVNHDEAVVVELCAGDKCTTVITYVGQTVQVGAHRVTIRTNEKGALVVESPDVDGMGEHPEQPIPGIRIKSSRI